MHPKRIQVLIRVFLLLILVAGGGYLGYEEMNKPLPRMALGTNQVSISLPSPKDQTLLKKALHWIDLVLPIAPPRLLPGIIAFKPPQMKFEVQLIFLGKSRFALINQLFYTIGSVLPDGREIIKITKQGVVVLNHLTRKKELIKFSAPHTVKLEKVKTNPLTNRKPGLSQNVGKPGVSQEQKTSTIKSEQVKKVLRIIQKSPK